VAEYISVLDLTTRNDEAISAATFAVRRGENRISRDLLGGGARSPPSSRVYDDDSGSGDLVGGGGVFGAGLDDAWLEDSRRIEVWYEG
jgi:hypothetical protein